MSSLHIWMAPDAEKSRRLEAMPEALQAALLELVDRLGDTSHGERLLVHRMLVVCTDTEGVPAAVDGVFRASRQVVSTFNACVFKAGES